VNYGLLGLGWGKVKVRVKINGSQFVMPMRPHSNPLPTTPIRLVLWSIEDCALVKPDLGVHIMSFSFGIVLCCQQCHKSVANDMYELNRLSSRKWKARRVCALSLSFWVPRQGEVEEE